MQEFFHTGGDSNGIPFFESGDEADILRDGEMGKETGLLNDVTDAAAKLDRIALGGGSTFDKDLSLRWDEHAIDELEESGLAAAAATEEDEGFPARDGQGNV